MQRGSGLFYISKGFTQGLVRLNLGGLSRYHMVTNLIRPSLPYVLPSGDKNILQIQHKVRLATNNARPC